MSLGDRDVSVSNRDVSVGDRDVSGKSIKVGRSGARQEENPEAWRRTCGGLRSVIRIVIRSIKRGGGGGVVHPTPPPPFEYSL